MRLPQPEESGNKSVNGCMVTNDVEVTWNRSVACLISAVEAFTNRSG